MAARLAPDHVRQMHQLLHHPAGYVVGVQHTTTVWKAGESPLSPKPWTGVGRPPTLQRRNKKQQPVSIKQLALSLPPQNWKNVSWREGTAETLRSRFAAVRPASAGPPTAITGVVNFIPKSGC